MSESKSSILDLINRPDANREATGVFQVGSVQYVQGVAVEAPERDPVDLSWDLPQPANMTPALHEPAQLNAPDVPRFEDGRIADPRGNLRNLAAEGMADDNKVIVVHMVDPEE